jgi:membrane protein YdbS with pleckstrin-like domain
MEENPVAANEALADRAWRGYDPRAALPLIALATAVSAVLLAGRWYLDDVSAAVVPYAIVLALWPSLLCLTLYRAITYTYRITDRALLVDRGFLNRPEPPLWLKDVNKVESGAGRLGHLLGIGWLKVTTTAGHEVTLSALHHPEAIAKLLNELIARENACRTVESSD